MKKIIFVGTITCSLLFLIACNNKNNSDSTDAALETTTVEISTNVTETNEESTTSNAEMDKATEMVKILEQYPDSLAEADIPESFLISNPVRIDRQSANSCSAYSLALVLRYFGEDIDGETIYADLNKDDTGSVWTQDVVEYVNATGKYTAKLYTGSINSLKEELNKGYPVFTSARVSREETGYHDIVVTGYDKDYIYIADSYKFDLENDYYNRAVTYDEFEFMWDTGYPEATNMFISIQKN